MTDDPVLQARVNKLEDRTSDYLRAIEKVHGLLEDALQYDDPVHTGAAIRDAQRVLARHHHDLEPSNDSEPPSRPDGGWEYARDPESVEYREVPYQ